MQEESRIAIIGGGAGGLVCAIAAAEEAQVSDNRVSVHIYESTDKIGRPILASGNGRCNFSNANIDFSFYHNADFAGQCISNAEKEFSPSTIGPIHPNCVAAWFYEHGLMYKEESEGRLYPRANKSSSVLDVLRLALERLDVHVHLNAEVGFIDVPSDNTHHLTMRMSDGSFERVDKIVIACGGAASKSLISNDMLSFEEMRPVLCPLKIDDFGRRITRKLENIRVRCEASLIRDGELVAKERGEAMFRKYGISGICIFNLSRFAFKGDTLFIDLFPDIKDDELKSLLKDRLNLLGKRLPSIENSEYLCGMLLPNLAEAVIERAGLLANASCDDEALSKLAHVLKHFEFIVEGPADIEHAQVQRGGFDVSGIEPSTMRVANAPRIHIIGEALDVDGPCGGYNLTWAFATGMLAGKAVAREI